MVYTPNVSCSETLTKSWTQSAIDCYFIGCNCSICSLNKLYFDHNSSKCMMKYTVLELVKKYGAPQTTIEEEREIEKKSKQKKRKKGRQTKL